MTATSPRGRLKVIQFTMTQNRSKLEIVTFEKLESHHIWNNYKNRCRLIFHFVSNLIVLNSFPLNQQTCIFQGVSTLSSFCPTSKNQIMALLSLPLLFTYHFHSAPQWHGSFA